MKEQADLKIVLKKGIISDELELERALIIDRKLRLLVKEYPELIESRKQLRSIIHAYEKLNWFDDSKITEKQIKESDNAEFFAEQERYFLEKRKDIIKEQLKKFDLTQQDLGKILGHGKSYMSELMNGVSPFSNKDLIIIHRLFHIKLEYLIPTFITQKEKERLKTSLNKINKPDLKLVKNDLIFSE